MVCNNDHISGPENNILARLTRTQVIHIQEVEIIDDSKLSTVITPIEYTMQTRTEEEKLQKGRDHRDLNILSIAYEVKEMPTK